MQKDIYVKMAEVENKHWWFASRTKIVESFIKKMGRKDLKILDMGCASGKNFEMLSKYGTITGFEPEEYSIEIAKEKNIAKEIVQGFMPQDAVKLKDKYDLIVLTDVLEHIENDEESLKALYNLLADNGKMIITVPALMWLWSHHDETHFHFRRYTVHELKNKTNEANFNINFISYFNFFLFFPIALIRLIKKIVPGLRNTNDLSKEPSTIVNKVLQTIFSSERFLLGKIKFPIGVSIIMVASKD